jgi:hypothetical protein
MMNEEGKKSFQVGRVSVQRDKMGEAGSLEPGARSWEHGMKDET